MCLTDLRQKREKYSLIVDYILHFAKTVLVVLFFLFFFLSHLIHVCWVAEVLGFIHPEEETKIRVNFSVIINICSKIHTFSCLQKIDFSASIIRLLHQVFSFSLWTNRDQTFFVFYLLALWM